MEVLFFLPLFLVFYAYFGYYLVLSALVAVFGRPLVSVEENPRNAPSVSVIVAAYDEEARIASRIEDILEQQYPGELEIIIASDGSTDGTVAKAREYEDRDVTVLDFSENRGRALVHNDSVAAAKGEIIVITDADSRFGPGFLKKITAPFKDPEIGATVGRLYFGGRDSAINQAEGFYWRWEVRTRMAEDRLGMLVNGCGAGMAFRKELFRPLDPVYDIDFITTMDIVQVGKDVRFVEAAQVFDEAPSTLAAEFKLRTRSAKRIMATQKRWGRSGWLRHPLYSWNLLSHKLLRWFCPFFLLTAFFANLALLSNPFFQMTLGFWLFGLVMAGAGFAAHLTNRRFAPAALFFGFFMANAGFFVGMIMAAMGKAPVKYKMPSDG